MPLTTRKATPEDAPLLFSVIDMASDGIVPSLWTAMAPADADGPSFGLALITAEDGEFSYRNAVIAERDGRALGGLIGYVLPDTPPPIAPDIPEAFIGIEKLAHRVPGHWYINFMAAVPDGRRQGVGATLLDVAETQARTCACPGIALIVAASNEPAISVYRRAGYRERERCPFDLSDFGAETTEAILMVKDLDPRAAR